MKRLLYALLLSGLAAALAHATGGLVCSTAGARPIQVAVGFGHVPGAPLLQDSIRLIDNGRQVPVKSAQWWLGNQELRLILIDPGAMREELVLRARRNGHVYDGNIWRGGKRRWVRCREG